MGEVYLARDETLHRDVALKLLPADFAADTGRVARFQREARLASQLSHPNIATIFEAGEQDGQHFIAMELVHGETLSERMRPAGLSEEDVLDLAIPLAEGLAEAHHAGILHRDLKPANVMVDERGRLKILDFGLSRPTQTAGDFSEDLTATGVIVGTPPFMAPEMMLHEKVDERSDLFSLGAILYELASGQRAFAGPSVAAVMHAVIEKQPMSVHLLNPNVSERFSGVVGRLLEKAPERRFQTAADLVAQLRVLKSPTSAILTTRPRSLRRNAWLAFLLVPAIVFGVWLTFFREAPGPRSIAVLPFLNVSGDSELEYLGDGITDSLIGHLAPLSDLRVIGRSSVFTFKDEGIDLAPVEAGRKLGVDTVLAGRVDQVQGNRVVHAMLLDVETGETLWTERFTTASGDLLAIEETISRAIADRLELRLSGTEEQRLERRSMTSPKAYDLYLQGRFHWRLHSNDGMHKALAYFREAIEEDPDFALAHVGVADSYLVDYGSWQQISGLEALNIAKRHVERALELDDALAEAYVSWAAMLQGEFRLEEAERAFRRALELNPDYGTAYQWHAELLALLGRPEEAIKVVEAGLEVDPYSLLLLTELAWAKLAADDPEGAVEAANLVSGMAPSFFFGRLVHAFAMHAARYPESEVVQEMTAAFSLRWGFSERELARVLETYESRGWKGFWEWHLEKILVAVEHENTPQIRLVAIYAQIGRIDEAFELIDRLIAAGDPNLTTLKRTAFNGPLESDPRWDEVLRRLGMPR